MEQEFLQEIRKRLVKSFMDVIVLKELENGNTICGHDLRALIHKKHHILISSGSIYSLLYYMERNGLIEGMMTSRKRVYKLTKKGEKTIKDVLNMVGEIQSFIKTLLSG